MTPQENRARAVCATDHDADHRRRIERCVQGELIRSKPILARQRAAARFGHWGRRFFGTALSGYARDGPLAWIRGQSPPRSRFHCWPPHAEIADRDWPRWSNRAGGCCVSRQSVCSKRRPAGADRLVCKAVRAAFQRLWIGVAFGSGQYGARGRQPCRMASRQADGHRPYAPCTGTNGNAISTQHQGQLTPQDGFASPALRDVSS